MTNDWSEHFQALSLPDREEIMTIARTASTGQRYPHSVFAKVKAQETERRYKAMKENKEEQKSSMTFLGAGVITSGSKHSHYDLDVVSSNDVGSGLASFVSPPSKKTKYSALEDKVLTLEAKVKTLLEEKIRLEKSTKKTVKILDDKVKHLTKEKIRLEKSTEKKVKTWIEEKIRLLKEMHLVQVENMKNIDANLQLRRENEIHEKTILRLKQIMLQGGGELKKYFESEVAHLKAEKAEAILKEVAKIEQQRTTEQRVLWTAIFAMLAIHAAS